MKDPGPLPFLDKGEEVILFSSGLLKKNWRSGWKPGRFYLTNRRLLFFQAPRIFLQALLENIIDLIKRLYIEIKNEEKSKIAVAAKEA